MSEYEFTKLQGQYLAFVVAYAKLNRRPPMAVDMLLNHQHLTLQDPDAVTAAVAHFRRRLALGFSDCLVLEVARKAGHLPLGTFDRNLATLDGAERL